jgi:hypothetical protein
MAVIDGRIIEKSDLFGHNTIVHSNCRGIWVAILQDEEDPPSIGGIPQTSRDRFGDAAAKSTLHLWKPWSLGFKSTTRECEVIFGTINTRPPLEWCSEHTLKVQS